jgi:endonuclease YncB( thermonuclease family)
MKEGTCINLEMIRKGYGKYDGATLAPDQQEAFRRAQERAKRDGLGIWK